MTAALQIEPFGPKSRHSDLIINCASDKSLTHRAIIFAAISEGRSTVIDPLLGDDCQSTISCFTDLGVNFAISGKDSASNPTLIIESPGLRQFQSPQKPLDCGNSGTTARLLCGLLAACRGLDVELIGDHSLSRRPMARVIEPLRRAGAQIAGANDDETLPIKIKGRVLKACAHELEIASAQVKSALLLSGINCHGTTVIRLPIGTRDHTERMLVAAGANCQIEQSSTHESIAITGPFIPKASDYLIPVDPSAAAFFVVLGLLRTNGKLILPKVLANPTRCGFLQMIQRMSDAVSVTKSSTDSRAHSLSYMEPVNDVIVTGGRPLKPLTIAASDIAGVIDEIPILAVLAAFAEGRSHFMGLGELRHKESDRLKKTYELLNLAGVKTKIIDDDLIVDGGNDKVEPFCYDPDLDHRMAMAATILAKRARAQCRLQDAQCVAVSFPKFFELMMAVG